MFIDSPLIHHGHTKAQAIIFTNENRVIITAGMVRPDPSGLRCVGERTQAWWEDGGGLQANTASLQISSPPSHARGGQTLLLNVANFD